MLGVLKLLGKSKDVRERISKSTKPSVYKPVGETRKFYVIERQTSPEFKHLSKEYFI